MKEGLVIFFFLGVLISALYLTCLSCADNQSAFQVKNEKLEFNNDLEFDKLHDSQVTVKPKPEPKKINLVGYEYKIKYHSTVNLYATCYSKLDGIVEARGIYANQKFADRLHVSERRIQRFHYTVAMPPGYKHFHEALIELPGGVWSHKYRVHVPGYNSPEIPDGKIEGSNQLFEGCQKYLNVFNNKYFSVPRDRMKQRGRIDCLITTAGKYNSLKQRLRNWKSLNKDVKIFEIQKMAVYSDGSKKVIK